MPSGTYKNEVRRCKICGKKLRPLKNMKDWESRKYHVTCFKELISDISNYNKVAYTKYGHTKLIAGLELGSALPEDGIKLDFS